ncbi:Ku protein [Haloferula sargassicola]|uniref:Non-homologous end joining protein Ku n=1 Tax=Haloferula sargassicola TaxID=490096 RepID=A0ABP9UNH5_9BACT
MARSIWKGSIAFGLVNIPVSLVSAESRPDVHLHMVDSRNHARIRYERVNADTGDEVPWDRIVKAYEHQDGEFVLLSEEDLDAVQPKLTKTIEISDFVALDEIDPLLFDKPYYLEPEKRGKKAYALLREALRKSGRAGISRVVIRTREYLSAMFVRDDALVLMLLRFPQELKATSKLELPESGDKDLKPAKREMDLALKLIDEMTTDWKPDDYHDEYREALMDFIEQKVRKGDAVADVKEGEAEADEGTKVVDLAAYLEKSVKERGGKTSSSKAKKSTRTKKHAAKKTARRKSKSA